MGLRSELLRQESNCIHTLVSAGGRKSGGSNFGADCESSSGDTDAGSAGVAVTAFAYHVADSRNIIGCAPGGEHWSRRGKANGSGDGRVGSSVTGRNWNTLISSARFRLEPTLRKPRRVGQPHRHYFSNA